MNAFRTFSALVLAGWLVHAPASQASVADDFADGLSLEEVVRNAHEDSGMSSGETVRQILQARPDLDEVDVLAAVIDAWPACNDAVAAIRATVDADNEKADEIVSAVVGEMNFHCTASKAWIGQRAQVGMVDSEPRTVVYAPVQCYSVYRLMEGAVSGLEELESYANAANEAESAAIVAKLADKISEMANAANLAQAAECECSGGILAGAAAAIDDDELLARTWQQLPGDFAGVESAACGTYSRNFVSSYSPHVTVRARRFTSITGPKCDDPTRCPEIDIASPN